ncbi:hypothetical protein [Jannaschia sp. R86511]|uniref:hypothetical protein n=1 Tax=Jannaschia sp. R86511 TaxID=3093853 RepID=UPI0036D29AB3
MAIPVAGVSVPKRAVGTLEYLARLSAEKVSRLVAALEDIPNPPSDDAVANSIDEALDAAGESIDGEDVLREAFSLTALIGSHGYPVGEMAAALSQSSDLDIDVAERGSLTAVLTQVLASPAIRSLGKAHDLAQEHERLVHTSRVVTDIRPIFEEATSAPLGAIVTHKLRLGYWKNGRIEEIEVTLPDSQLERLRVALDRAKEKGRSVQALLSDWEVPIFTTDDEDAS